MMAVQLDTVDGCFALSGSSPMLMYLGRRFGRVCGAVSFDAERDGWNEASGLRLHISLGGLWKHMS